MENKIMENEEVVAATEEIATNAKSGKGIKVAIGVVATTLVGGLVYKRVIKPIIAKVKAKKEQRKAGSHGCYETEPKMIFDENGNPID